MWCAVSVYFFFFNDTATTEIYTLSLHDALPICQPDEISGVPRPRVQQQRQTGKHHGHSHTAGLEHGKPMLPEPTDPCHVLDYIPPCPLRPTHAVRAPGSAGITRKGHSVRGSLIFAFHVLLTVDKLSAHPPKTRTPVTRRSGVFAWVQECCSDQSARAVPTNSQSAHAHCLRTVVPHAHPGALQWRIR